MDSLRLLLKNALDLVDRGECDHISVSELEIIANIVHQPVSVGREDAAKYLGVSLNRFHELRNNGTVKEPKKVKGKKELAYSMVDLKEAKKRIDKM